MFSSHFREFLASRTSMASMPANLPLDESVRFRGLLWHRGPLPRLYIDGYTIMGEVSDLLPRDERPADALEALRSLAVVMAAESGSDPGDKRGRWHSDIAQIYRRASSDAQVQASVDMVSAAGWEEESLTHDAQPALR